MALMKSAVVPKDAVELSEIDAASYAWELVTDWDSLSDTWALRYGSAILGGLNALSSLIITQHYRNKLKLGSYGYFSTVVPLSVMPAVITALFHRHNVATSMLLMKETCPICYEMRSAAIQLGMGLVYPMVLAPTASLMFATRHSTSRVPYLQEGPKVMLKFLSKLTRPLKGTIATLAVTQFLASSAVTYLEMKNHLTMRRKIVALENRILQEIDNNK